MGADPNLLATADPPVSVLISMSGFGGMVAERVEPFPLEYDDNALPGRRGAMSVAKGALSESESESLAAPYCAAKFPWPK